MDYTDNAKLEEFMLHNLKEKRYIHSLGVEQMAATLAKCHGADVDKAAFAGRYHDIAKCFSDEFLNRLIRDFGISDEYRDNQALAHSKVAAALLEYEFNVADEDVLAAVAGHTTGREGMSLLEEIVYVADAIEVNRKYDGLTKLQEQAREDLDAACLFIMDYTIDLIQSKGRKLDKDTSDARQYINERIIRRENDK